MTAEIYARIGDAIRRRRDAIGLSQASLAEKIGLGRTSITMIEGGAQALLVHQLLDIAKALKTTPTDLLAESDTKDEMGPSRTLYQSSLVEGLMAELDQKIGRITR